MRLKTTVFLWGFLVTAVPLAVLALVATVYSESLYQRDVERAVFDNLGSIVSEVGRRLLLEQEAVEALAEVPAVVDFLPVLAAANEGERDPLYASRVQAVSRSLEAFQTMIPSVSTIRIMDASGNVVVKVQSGRAVAPTFEGMAPIPYAEEELPQEASARTFEGVSAGELAFRLLPVRDDEPADLSPPPLLDLVRPLGDPIVGYVSVTIRRGPINRLIQVMPRTHRGELIIAEVNPDNPERDGLLLYDERSGLELSGDRVVAERLQEVDPELHARVQVNIDGVFDDLRAGTRTYFVEYLPYPDRLITWAVALRVQRADLVAPFEGVRAGIAIAACLGLVMSLLVAQFGASEIAGPVMDLAERLRAYAAGDRTVRVREGGPEEVREAGRAFNRMADSLARAETELEQANRAMLHSTKLAAIGQMAAGVGHEINNPVGNILSLTRLMERSWGGDEELRGDIHAVRDEALRVSRIVKAVLNFARQTPRALGRVDVTELVHECLALTEAQARERSVSIQSSVAGDGVLEGDRDLLQQTFINLILNAVQASPRGGRVDVRVAGSGNELVVAVEDGGGGIAESDLERIYDPFFTTKDVGEGSGLGLSISLGIVQQHGGTLEIRNRAEGGVVATVRLPRAAAQERAAGTPREAQDA